MTWQEQFKGDTFSWLLEDNNPGIRYLTLRDLLGLPPTDPKQATAQALKR